MAAAFFRRQISFDLIGVKQQPDLVAVANGGKCQNAGQLRGKIALAQDEIANELMMFLLKRLPFVESQWLPQPVARQQIGVSDVAVTGPLRQWHVYKTLALIYRDAYNNLGLALSDLGEFEAAVHAYTQALTIDTHDWHAYSNRGLALWALGRRDDALRDYEKVKVLLGS